jgi:hypothetical protein
MKAVDRGPSAATGVFHAALLACALTAVIAAPVLVSPRQRLFGAEIVGRQHDPFTVVAQLAGAPVGIGYRQPVTDVPGRLLARIVGPIAALNLLLLVSFPLSAAAAYLLARHAFDSHAGALFASLLFAFSPFHLAQAAYHPHIAQTQWLPLYLLALWRCLDDAARPRLAWLAGATVLVTLSSFYGGFTAAVITPAAILVAAVAARHAPERRRALVRTTAFLAGMAALGGALLATTIPGLTTSAAAYAFPREHLFLFSARWWSYLVPPVHHPLFGHWAAAFWVSCRLPDGVLEQQVSLGWSVLALAAIPLYLHRRRAWAVAIIVAVALVCSLSPERAILGIRFIRPSALLYTLVPMFRAYARFGAVVQLGVAVLAGFGLAILLGSGRRGLAWLLAATAAFEYAPVPPWPWRDVLPTAAHRWIEQQPGPVRVLDCVPPSLPEWTVPALMSHPMLFLTPPLDDCADPDLAQQLASRGLTHVLVRKQTPVGAWTERVGPPAGLRLVRAFDDASVFAVTTLRETPPIVGAASLGLYEREFEGQQTWRWMAEEARMTVLNTTGKDLSAHLDLELAAFLSVRHVAVLINARIAADLLVDPAPPTEPHRYRVETVLPPGETVVVIRSLEPPAVPADVGTSNDRRSLSIALGSWRWSLADSRP